MAPVADDAAGRGLFRRLDEVTDALHGLVGLLGREEGLSSVLDRGCGQAVRAVPGAEMVGVSCCTKGVRRPPR